ncbi:MAG: hypothetical protein WCK31_04530 [bacterium]
MAKKLESMYKTYFQKSQILLFPALEIKRGGSVTPIQTFVAWKGNYEIGEAKLCTLYHLRDDQEFRVFEQQWLMGNKIYHDFKQVDTNKGVYVFDFSTQQEDWNNFVDGKYSLMSESHKKKVLAWLGYNNANYAHVESFLYPEKYFKIYAELANVDEYDLRKVGQLCNKPDFDKETLEMSIVNLDMIKNLT